MMKSITKIMMIFVTAMTLLSCDTSADEKYTADLQSTGDEGDDQVSVALLGPGDADMVSSVGFTYSGNTIFVGTDIGGLYYTTDGGTTWKSCNRGLKNYDVSTTVLQSPTEKNTFWVGTRGGIYKTIDAASNWSATWGGLTGPLAYKISTPVGAIAINPANPEILYMGLGSRPDQKETEIRSFVRSAMDGRLYKSTDSGKSWNALSTIYPNCIIRSLLVESGDVNKIYAATSEGLFKSGDDGNTWQKVLSGDARCIVSKAGTLYCSIADQGVYQSMDGGSQWKLLGTGLPAGSDQNYSVVACTNEGVWVLNSLWAASGGAYVLKTDAQGWAQISSKSFPSTWLSRSNRFNAIAVNPVDERQIVIGTSRYVYRSNDSGKTWDQLISRPSSMCWSSAGLNVFGGTLCFAVDATDPNALYIGTADHGLVKSCDGGNSWKASVNGMTYKEDVSDILSSRVGERYIYAICSNKNTQALVRSSDGGESWADITGTLFAGQKLLSICFDNNSSLLIATESAVYRSSDRGGTWQQLGTQYSASKYAKMCFDQYRSSLLLASNNGLFRLSSSNLWERVTPSTINNITAIYCDQNLMAIGTMRDSKSSGGIYISNDNGLTWKSVTSGFAWISSIVKCQDIYLASTNINNYCDESSGQGLIMSKDGLNWTPLQVNLPVNRVTRMETDPSNHTVVYLCLSGAGLARVTLKIPS